MKEKTRVNLELFKRGYYKHLGLFDKQLEALSYLRDSQTTEVLYGGAARGGKSWLGCKWIIHEASTKPNSAWYVAREEMTKLRDTTLNTFFKVLSAEGFKSGEDFKYNGSSMTFTFWNGSKVYFREVKYIPSDPEFDRIGSYDLTGAFLDEVQQIHEKALNVLRGRFSVLSGDGWETIPKVFMSANPSKTWIYSQFYKADKENRLPEYRQFVQALPTDNPHNSEEYLKNLLRSDKTTVERLYYGNWEYDDDPMQMLSYDEICDIFSNTELKDKYYLVGDPARQGKDEAVYWVFNGMVGVERVALDKTTIPEQTELVKRLQKKYKIPNRNLVIDGNGVGGGVVDSTKAYNFMSQSKPLKKENYGNLRDQCGFRLQKAVRDNDFRLNHPESDDIKQELEQLKKVADDKKERIIKKDDIKKNIGKSPNDLDCFIMHMYNFIKPKKTFTMH